MSLNNSAKGDTHYSEEMVDTDRIHHSRKVSAGVGVLLLFLLIVSIFFGIRQKRISEFKKSYQDDLTSAQHSLEESVNLLELNPQRSRELFIDAREKVLGLSTKNIKDSRIDDLKSKIESSQGRILGEYHEDAKIFVDLQLLSDGFAGDNMVFTNGFLYVMDSENKRIIKTEVSNKHSEVIAGPSKIEEAGSLAAYIQNVYVSGSKGIVKVSDEKKTVIEKSWQEPVLTYSFGGNFYILEKNNSKIWRYSGNGESFGSPTEWLASGNSPVLSDAFSWAIDGNIWVIKTSGEIYKFSMGNQRTFRLEESASGFYPDFIYAEEESEFLYLLDKEDRSIKVFDKEGKYIAKYISDAIAATSEIAVSEKEKKIFLLNGTSLYSIGLKHSR